MFQNTNFKIVLETEMFNKTPLRRIVLITNFAFLINKLFEYVEIRKNSH